MSALTERLKPLQECIAGIRESCEESIRHSIKYQNEERDEKIARVERNRPILALLDAEGFDVTTFYYGYGESAKIELGFFPSSGAGSRAFTDKLRTIRLILDAKLGKPSKDVADDKKGHVVFSLEPPDYPGIRIRYTRRLPRGAKCKIVTTKSVYRRLVCDVE